jgi:SAM-dependent methyltransferase
MTDLISISVNDFNKIYRNIDEHYQYSKIHNLDVTTSNEQDIRDFIDRYLILIDGNNPYKNNTITSHLFEIHNIYKRNNCLISNYKPQSKGEWYDSYNPYYQFIYIVCQSINCQNIIKSSDLDMFTNDKLEALCLIAAEKGSCPLFIYMYDFVKSKIITTADFNIKCFYHVLANTDDRMYKVIINRVKTDNVINIDDLCKQTIINKIFVNHIPIKYILRRLKLLSTIINFDSTINELLIASTCHGNNFILIKNILKYYNTDCTLLSDDAFPVISSCVVSSGSIDSNQISSNVNTIYDLLITNLDKNRFIINLLIRWNTTFNLRLIKTKDSIPSVNIAQKINLDTIDASSYDIIGDIFSIYSYYDISRIVSRFNYKSIRFIIPFIKYFNPCHIYCNTLDEIVKLNKFLLYLRVYIRKKRKVNSIGKKLLITPLLHELMNLTPSHKAIFKNGTSFFQNKKQCFNTTPPSHILPGQLQLFKNNNYFLKEKADGILCYTLPLNIVPEIKLDKKIKAEYIEDLDLYLVFDIDMNMTIEDRYNYLRKLHPSTHDISYNLINCKEDLIKTIETERDIFNKFLLEPYTTYRWYPKAAWKINCHNNLIDFYIDILNTNENKWLCEEGSVINDGLIITPLSGDREIKIKPRKLMTIDLLYKKSQWLDREGTCYNDIIKINNDINLSDSTIWRCYPVAECISSYQPRELRTDKTKPNPSTVISSILSLINIKYVASYPIIYRTIDIFRYSNEWKDTVDINSSIIRKLIKRLPCKNILDFGCGNGKLLRYIKNFTSYHGVDMDVNMLARGSSNNSSGNICFNNIDLSLEWNQPGRMWNNILCQRTDYDTITAINSLQHFSTDIFWEQLNQITCSGTKMLFNLVSMENNTKYEFEKDNSIGSYIERKDNMVYYMFSSVHTEPMSEPYIDKINYILEKYGWDIIQEYNPKTLLLPSNYTWYIVVRR